jgi:glutathione S-transferase
MGTVGVDNLTDLQRLQMSGKRQAGRAALKLMDDHLNGREWFVADGISLADVCLFAYTHVAGDAEFKLHEYPHVGEWIERIKGQPRYVAMNA